jgi:hypothetical protein
VKILFAVEFDVVPDWEDSIFRDGGEGRKLVVTNGLRRAVMSAVMRESVDLVARNGINVNGVWVSEPVFDELDTESPAHGEGDTTT